MAPGRLLKIIDKCQIKFHLDKSEFEEEFLVLPAMKSMLLGKPSFITHDLAICPSRNLLLISQMTYHMNEVKVGEKSKRLKNKKKIK